MQVEINGADEQPRKGRRAARTAFAASGLLVLAIGAAACGSGSSTPSSSGSTSSTSTSTSSTSTSTSTSTTTTLPPPLARGQQGTGSAIPWGEVGAGWSVAIWSPGSSRPSTIFVVDPQGGRYAAASLPASNTYYAISDWSGDKQRVLVTSGAANAVNSTTVTDIDLATGATVGSFDVTGLGILSAVEFSRPTGLDILAGSYPAQGGQPILWRRYSPTGTVQQTFPGTFSQVGSADDSAVYTPDGAAVVIGATSGAALVENNGTVETQLPVPGASQGCQVMHWWEPGEVLALCSSSSGAASFWAVPVSGAAPTEVTPIAEENAGGGDPLDLWQVDGSLYAQFGVCGTLFIDKIVPGSAGTAVAVPGTASSGSQRVTGVYGDNIQLIATSSCDTAAPAVQPSLFTFDVATGTSTVLLGAPLNGGSVVSAFLYDSEGY
jgi:hypothetical protein